MIVDAILDIISLLLAGVDAITIGPADLTVSYDWFNYMMMFNGVFPVAEMIGLIAATFALYQGLVMFWAVRWIIAQVRGSST